MVSQVALRQDGQTVSRIKEFGPAEWADYLEAPLHCPGQARTVREAMTAQETEKADIVSMLLWLDRGES